MDKKFFLLTVRSKGRVVRTDSPGRSNTLCRSVFTQKFGPKYAQNCVMFSGKVEKDQKQQYQCSAFASTALLCLLFILQIL